MGRMTTATSESALFSWILDFCDMAMESKVQRNGEMGKRLADHMGRNRRPGDGLGGE